MDGGRRDPELLPHDADHTRERSHAVQGLPHRLTTGVEREEVVKVVARLGTQRHEDDAAADQAGRDVQ